MLSDRFGALPSADPQDDPSGKQHKVPQQRTRKQVMYSVLLGGVCLGFMASQQLYMHHQRWEEQVPRRHLRQKAPRSELEGILQRIAPEREVMIAISNYNLVLEGMLTTWLEVNDLVELVLTPSCLNICAACFAEIRYVSAMQST